MKRIDKVAAGLSQLDRATIMSKKCPFTFDMYVSEEECDGHGDTVEACEKCWEVDIDEKPEHDSTAEDSN